MTLVAVGIGEVLWDLLPDGAKLGGAPANFAYHVNALGGTGIPVSRVGNDGLGRDAVAYLKSCGLDVSCIDTDDAHPTGTVEVKVDEAGVATYTFPDDVAWDNLVFTDGIAALAKSVDIVCFGSLAQRSLCSREAVYAFLKALPERALKVFDVNLRQTFYSAEVLEASLGMADIAKLNDEELPVVCRLLGLADDAENGNDAGAVLSEREVMQRLLARFSLRAVVLTRGAEGSCILSADEVSELDGAAVEVADTVGAGDAFTAAFSMGLVTGWTLEQAHRMAAEVAAYVCTCSGAMPEMPEGIRIE